MYSFTRDQKCEVVNEKIWYKKINNPSLFPLPYFWEKSKEL